MLKLYYSPAACSLAVHLALEESGLEHSLERVNAREGQTREPAYLAINPLGQVPALQLPDGRVLTEVLALLGYVADKVPARRLLPTDPLGRARALSWMSYFACSVHGAFRDWISPGDCASSELAQSLVRSTARERYFAHLQRIEARIGETPWLLGDEYSLVDGYAFCFYLWGQIFEWPVAELPRYRALAQRVAERPATRRALEAEGFVAERTLRVA